jgi:GNAT superfamily N-acetyltransferase
VESPTEAWLEGGRVAPRWRRNGIAAALIAHRIAYARERGFRVLRFSTASDNTPIHGAAKQFGFRRIATLSRYEAPATQGSPPARATPAQWRAVLRRIEPLVQRGHGWEWREITARDLRGLRAEAQRRRLDDVSFYVSNATERRAARSAAYRRPWPGETYLFEKRL